MESDEPVTAAAPSAPRIVPGARPPIPLTKSQLKRKKRNEKTKQKDEGEIKVNGTGHAIPDATAAALVDSAPAASDIADGKVDETLVAPPEELKAAMTEEEKYAQKFPAVEFIAKRQKVLQKKIARIKQYSDKPASELNEDQKKTLETLPGLQGAVKELEDLKKGLENVEIEQVAARQAQRAVERAEADFRIQEAVAVAEAAQMESLKVVLSFLRLHSLLLAGEPGLPPVSDPELQAINLIQGLLVSSEADRDEVISGLTRGEGSIQDIEYLRMREILNHFLFPPSEEPVEPAFDAGAEPDVIVVSEAVEPNGDVNINFPTHADMAPSSAFHFIQQDELDPLAGPSMEGVGALGSDHLAGPNGTAAYASAEADQILDEMVEVAMEAELVKEELEEAIAEAVLEEAIAEAVLEEAIEEAVEAIEEAIEEEIEAAEPAPVDTVIDWSAEDDLALPSVAQLQASFGTSGEVTPDRVEPVVVVVDAPAAAVAGLEAPPPIDGFAPGGGRGRGRFPRGGGGGGGDERGGYRGRGGRGRGGFRGGRGGGFNGAAPGPAEATGAAPAAEVDQAPAEDGWQVQTGRRGQNRGRGGEGGSFRGGEGGGFRGGRGDFRGGRGDFRGGRGDFRGGRGNGEFRGGRGDFRGGREEFRGRVLRGGFRGGVGRGGGDGAGASAAPPTAA